MDQALREYNETFDYKITTLRPYQKTCLESIVNKGDTLCILPTGYGKSLIYEILPFVSKQISKIDACVIVILPLNTIVHQEMKKLGHHALHLTDNVISQLKSKSNSKETQRLKSAEYKYIITHPENILGFRALNDVFMNERYQKDRQIFVVIDEAHCILEWGSDFRPEFVKIFKLRSIFPNCTVLAMSATVTQEGQSEIASKLLMKSPSTISCSPTKDNIALIVVDRPNFAISTKDAYDYVFLPLLQDLKGQGRNFPMTIVYCRGMDWAGYGFELAQKVLGQDMATSRVIMYHSSIEKDSDKLKRDIIQTLQQPLEQTSLRLVFATVALWMGADLQHVKQVIHAGCPKTLESYVQQIGRSGRSGRPATAIMFCNKADSGSASKSMKDYCRNAEICRRKLINEHFGCSNTFDALNPCCDICQTELSVKFHFTTTINPHLYQMKYALLSYIKLDSTGKLRDTLSADVIDIICQNFTLFKIADRLTNTFQLQTTVSHSVSNILSAF